MKLGAGMSLARQIPAFAPMTFSTWFRRAARAPRERIRPRVLLWPDTFNNSLPPAKRLSPRCTSSNARASRSRCPSRPLCCGRPLYDYGMLDTAQRWLEEILTELRPALDAGVPIVGLEPSCVAVFRDELGGLFPQRADARQLRERVSLLSEFLRHAGVAPPPLRRRAIVHGHCHHKAVLDFEAEEAVLRSMQLDLDVLDSGCCGMAGAFGFEDDHADISRRIGERVLAPAVRRAGDDAIIVADGFSCREQIRQLTGRRALHLADVLDMAAREGPGGPAGALPERAYAPDYAAAARNAVGPSLAVAGAVALAGVAAWYGMRDGRPAGRRTPGGPS